MTSQHTYPSRYDKGWFETHILPSTASCKAGDFVATLTSLCASTWTRTPFRRGIRRPEGNRYMVFLYRDGLIVYPLRMASPFGMRMIFIKRLVMNGWKDGFCWNFLIILLLMEVDEIHPTHQLILDNIPILIGFHISSISRQDFVS